MSGLESSGGGLAARLRGLRREWNLAQRQLSEALSLSGALISSWENGSAVPPEERLNSYARFFATRRSIEQDPPTLIRAEDLTSDEERARSDLIDELVRLREEALHPTQARARQTGALGGRFWYFSDGQPVTILCTPLSLRQLGYTPEAAEAGTLPPAVQYATNPTHPNALRNLGNGDIDSLVELAGHIRAENPTAAVHWLTFDRITSADQLSGHIVILGYGDGDINDTPEGNTLLVRDFRAKVDLPVRFRWADPNDEEFGGEFVVKVDANGIPVVDDTKVDGEEVYRPRFIRDESAPSRPRVLANGAPQLVSDVALIHRTRNPLNPNATLTWVCGMFSRGTYGGVRAFTDAIFRARNEQWLANTLDPGDFWFLCQVSVVAGQTITPDLGRAANRLRMSS